jgi:thiamine-phosphate pyrophosphorylase
VKAYAIANLSEGESGEPALLERVDALSRLQVDIIQLRAKHLDDRALLDLAIRCRDRISPSVLYLVNGRADIAVAAEADGVHLPSDGVPVSVVREIGPGLTVGVSCHSVEEVENAAEAGAELVVFGPVFAARSGRKAPVVSKFLVGAAAAERRLEVYALGGLTVDNVRELQGTGVTGVAAITMFMEDEPIDQIVTSVREARA